MNAEVNTVNPMILFPKRESPELLTQSPANKLNRIPKKSNLNKYLMADESDGCKYFFLQRIFGQ